MRCEALSSKATVAARCFTRQPWHDQQVAACQYDHISSLLPHSSDCTEVLHTGILNNNHYVNNAGRHARGNGQGRRQCELAGTHCTCAIMPRRPERGLCCLRIVFYCCCASSSIINSHQSIQLNISNNMMSNNDPFLFLVDWRCHTILPHNRAQQKKSILLISGCRHDAADDRCLLWAWQVPAYPAGPRRRR